MRNKGDLLKTLRKLQKRADKVFDVNDNAPDPKFDLATDLLKLAYEAISCLPNRGDVLVWFAVEDVQEQARDLRIDLRLNRRDAIDILLELEDTLQGYLCEAGRDIIEAKLLDVRAARKTA